MTFLEETIIRNTLILFTEMIYDLKIEIAELKGTLNKEEREMFENYKKTKIELIDEQLFPPSPPSPPSPSPPIQPPGPVDPRLNE